MRKSRRIIGLMLVLILLVSVMALPASAALNSTWRNKFGNFRLLYNGVVAGNYVRALQRFLLCDESNYYLDIITLDGMDGGFGNHTQDAVQYFQWQNGLKQDGRVGPDTWKAVSDHLYQSSINNNYVVLYDSDYDPIYYVYVGASAFIYQYYTMSNTVGNTFHED